MSKLKMQQKDKITKTDKVIMQYIHTHGDRF